jgi:hypothetical protein
LRLFAMLRFHDALRTDQRQVKNGSTNQFKFSLPASLELSSIKPRRRTLCCFHHPRIFLQCTASAGILHLFFTIFHYISLFYIRAEHSHLLLPVHSFYPHRISLNHHSRIDRSAPSHSGNYTWRLGSWSRTTWVEDLSSRVIPTCWK